MVNSINQSASQYVFPEESQIEFSDAIRDLSLDQRKMVLKFISLVSDEENSVTINLFWRLLSDPCLDSLILNASLLDDDELDELVFSSEELLIEKNIFTRGR